MLSWAPRWPPICLYEKFGHIHSVLLSETLRKTQTVAKTLSSATGLKREDRPDQDLEPKIRELLSQITESDGVKAMLTV